MKTNLCTLSRVVGLAALATAAALSLGACNTVDGDIEPAAPSVTGIGAAEVATSEEFSEEVAAAVRDAIADVVASPDGTAAQFEQLTTTSYLREVLRVDSHQEALDNLREREEFEEFDPVLAVEDHGVVQANRYSPVTELSYTVLDHTYAAAPEEKTCTLKEQWIREADRWKLSGARSDDCPGFAPPLTTRVSQ